MTTNYHTAISLGAAANAGTFNSPLGELDAAITDILNGITFTGDIILDDGAGNSPMMRFRGGSNDDEVQFYLLDDATAGYSDLAIKLADAAGNSEIRIKDSTAADVIWMNSDGRLRTAGPIFISETLNSLMTLGLTINQGGNDDEILALKSSDVAHGVTARAETDTFLAMRKISGDAGGLEFRAFTEDNIALSVAGVSVNDNTAKTTAATAPILLNAMKKSGTDWTTCGADANLVVIRNESTARFIFDAEGSAHADVEWTTFQEHDDIGLLAKLEDTLSAWRDPEAEVIQADRDELEQLKLIRFDDDNPGHALLNITRLHMLVAGAARQLDARLANLEVKAALLEGS